MDANLRNIQVNMIQLQLLQTRLDSSRNVLDVVVVDFSRDIQLLTWNTALLDRGA